MTLIFTSGYPIMRQLDRADPNLRNLLLSEFEDLESALQKTGHRVCTLVEEHLRSFLRCVKCRVLCRITASVASSQCSQRLCSMSETSSLWCTRPFFL